MIGKLYSLNFNLLHNHLGKQKETLDYQLGTKVELLYQNLESEPLIKEINN